MFNVPGTGISIQQQQHNFIYTPILCSILSVHSSKPLTFLSIKYCSKSLRKIVKKIKVINFHPVLLQYITHKILGFCIANKYT